MMASERDARGRGHGIEAGLRVRFRARCRINCPAVRIIGIPNAAKRGQWAATHAKREGLQAGFPDDLILWDGGGVAFIEWKSPGGRLSPNQREWQGILNRMGFPCCVADDPDEAIAWLAAMGAPVLGVLAL